MMKAAANTFKRNILIGAAVAVAFAFTYKLSTGTGFEEQPVGTAYDKSAWERDGFKVAWTQALEKNSAVDDQQRYEGSKSLKVTYPKGTFGPAENGGQAKLMLPPRQEYYASYRLRFSENFSWGGEHEGGKLPGLAGGDNCSGGQSCDGTNGFSARFMWRKGGKAVLYLYHMDKPHQWGEDIDLRQAGGQEVVFPRGEWVQLAERVKLNTISNGKANADGEVQVWYNGELVLNKKGLRFVSNQNGVDNFYFSTFHGGNTIEWAPQETCWIWYDDIKVSDNQADVM
ncbi:polysaccharide lyase polysaccharide lyase family 14 protein [Flammeovirgaceae bacterium 311]|nr:polysaccharide lyase polysaccharide lyase family 14 protein [Flammeovirgaceae bacterium 311]